MKRRRVEEYHHELLGEDHQLAVFDGLGAGGAPRSGQHAHLPENLSLAVDGEGNLAVVDGPVGADRAFLDQERNGTGLSFPVDVVPLVERFHVRDFGGHDSSSWDRRSSRWRPGPENGERSGHLRLPRFSKKNNTTSADGRNATGPGKRGCGVEKTSRLWKMSRKGCG